MFYFTFVSKLTSELFLATSSCCEIGFTTDYYSLSWEIARQLGFNTGHNNGGKCQCPEDH